MSIRLRLALAVAAVAAVLTTAGGAAFAASLSAELTATLHDELRSGVARVQRELGAGRLSLTSAQIRPTPTGDQSVVQVIAPTGGVVYATDSAGRGILLSPRQLAAARRGPTFLTRHSPRWPGPMLLLAAPARRPGGAPAGAVVVGVSLDELDHAMARVAETLLIGGPLVVVIVGAGGWVLAGLALRPVERMRAQAAALSERSRGARLATVGAGGELASLAGTFNGLLDRLHGALDTQRAFVAAAGHELRTPLAVLSAEVELAQRPGRPPAEVDAALDVISSRLGQLSRLAQDLLLLARGDERGLALVPVTQPLEPLVAGSLLAFRNRAQAREVTLVLTADPEVAAAVDGGRFGQMVDNLVANAIEHGGEAGLVEVVLRRSGDSAEVSVRDHGPGLPESFLPHAFERFSRAEAARARDGGGAGLGLSIVAMLAQAHGGSAGIRNCADGGALAWIEIPAPAAERG